MSWLIEFLWIYNIWISTLFNEMKEDIVNRIGSVIEKL
jgi:hypothetical protein